VQNEQNIQDALNFAEQFMQIILKKLNILHDPNYKETSMRANAFLLKPSINTRGRWIVYLFLVIYLAIIFFVFFTV